MTGRRVDLRRMLDTWTEAVLTLMNSPSAISLLVWPAASDPVLAAAFLRVNHLVERPQDLMRPALAVRVLRSSLPHRRDRAARQQQEPRRALEEQLGTGPVTGPVTGL